MQNNECIVCESAYSCNMEGNAAQPDEVYHIKGVGQERLALAWIYDTTYDLWMQSFKNKLNLSFIIVVFNEF